MASFSRMTLGLMLSFVALLTSNVNSQILPQSQSTVYRATSGIAPTAVTFTSATPVLGAIDDTIDSGMQIGFTFVFYNTSYTVVNLGSNGNMQFQSTSTAYSPAAFGSDTYAQYSPWIAIFHTDLYPTTAGMRTYGTIGTSPNRQFIYRYTYVGYCCSNTANQGLSVDVVLSEGTNTVELRYYSILDSSRYVSVGIQSANNGAYDWVSILNYQLLNSTTISNLVGKSYTFTPIVPFTNALPFDPSRPSTSFSSVYNADMMTAPALEAFTSTGSLISRNDGVTEVDIGFNFVYYGTQYSKLYLSDNGNVQFQSAYPVQYPYSFGASNANLVPMIAFFFSDMLNTVGTRTYGLAGTAPNRRWIYRLTNVNFQTYVTAGTLSMDVILYETTNQIEMRFYTVPTFLYTYYYCDIGLQNRLVGSTYDYVSVVNYNSISAYLASLLTNKAYVFSPRTPFVNPTIYPGPQAPVPVVTGSRVYNASAAFTAPTPVVFTPSGSLSASDVIAPVELGFRFNFYNIEYSSVYISSKGNMQFKTYSTSVYPYTLGTSSNSALSPFIAFAFSDMLPSTTAGTRTYATMGQAPNRYFILRLTSVPFQTYISAETLTMDVILYEGSNNIEFRYYSVPSFTSYSYYMDIGIQNASVGTTYDNVAIVNYRNMDLVLATGLRNKAYTISPLTPFTNPTYYPGPQAPVPVNTASTVYTALHAAAVPARVSFTPAGTLPKSDNGVTRAPLGFSFVFYNISYTSVIVADNGNLQWQTGATNNYPYTWGSSNLALTPFIGFFYADLLPNTVTSVRTYGTAGQAPNRYWILRLENVPYMASVAPSTNTLSMDVLLYEGSNNIEFRYYTVPAMTSTSYYLDIGLQNQAVNSVYDYVSIMSYVNLNGILAPTLANKSYTIQPRAPFVNPQVFNTTILPQSSSSMYTATYSQGSLPPQVAFTPLTNPSLPITDNEATYIPIGFPFTFMNVSYSSLWCGSNGLLAFEGARISQYPYAFGSNGAVTPAIYFFYADLAPTTAASVRTYGLIGSAPNRQFILRYSNVALQTYISTDKLSVDVILTEGTNSIEFRYYAVPTFISTSYYATIGIENKPVGTAAADWISIVNYKSISSIVQEGLNQTSYRFTPTTPFTNPSQFVPIRPTVATSVVSTYAVTSRTTVPDLITFTPSTPALPVTDDTVTRVNIGFNFTFYGLQYSQMFISSNANLQFQTGSTSIMGGAFAGTANTALWPFIAVFHTDLLPVSVTSYSYGVAGTAPNRQFVVRYNAVPFAVSSTTPALTADVILSEGTGNIELRYYSVAPSPTTSQYVSVGIAASVGDYVSIVSGIVMNGAQALGLTGTSYLITPVTPFVNPPVWTLPPLVPVDYSVYYNSVVVPNPVSRATFVPTTTPALPTSDDAVTTVPIGFTFNFYNRSYTNIVVSSNGNLQFLTASTDLSAGTFGGGNAEITPFIAHWHADLYPTFTGARTYGVMGSVPNRQFIVRYSDVWYCCSINAGMGLDMDVILYETTDVIELRYYRIPLDSSSRYVTVGIENSLSGSNTPDYVSVLNDVLIDAVNSDQLTNKTVRFLPGSDVPSNPVVPVNPAIAPQPTTTSTMYNATARVAPAAITLTSSTPLAAGDDAVQSVPLGFSFIFYNVTYTNVVVSTNGNLQFASSETSYSPDQFGGGVDTLTPFIAFSHTDMYSSIDGDRVYATVGTTGSRMFVLRLINIGYCCTAGTAGAGFSIDVILYEGSNNIEFRYYSLLSSTSRTVAAGIENRPVNGVYDFISILNNVVMTNTIADTMRGVSYTFMPIRPFVPVVVPPVTPDSGSLVPVYNSYKYMVSMSTAPLAVRTGMTTLTGADDRIDVVQIGFPFAFYNRTYSTVTISSNGNLQLQTSSTGYTNSLFGQTTASSYVPVIAFFFCDLTSSSIGVRSYQTIGTAPNRQFIVRYDDVPYLSLSVPGSNLLMEVILTETTNTIDMHYSRVQQGTRTVEIGLQNSGNNLNDWVSIWNDAAISAVNVSSFANKVIRYTPVNQGQAALPPTPVYNSNSYQVAVSSAPELPTRTGMTELTDADDRVDRVSMGFTFVFYNQTYTTVAISSNGNLQLVTNAVGYTNSLFGQTTAATYAPVIAFFFCDLNPLAAGVRSYQTIGNAPNRQFVVRFDDVAYLTGSVIGQNLLMEVILTETTNTIEMRYYRVQSSTRTVEIGLQNSGNGLTDWVYIWNDAAFTSYNVSSITGQNIKYTPVNQIPTPVVITPVYNSPAYAVTILNATSLPDRTGMTNLPGADDGITSVQFGFSFMFYNRTFTGANISTNGDLQFSTASTSYTNQLFANNVVTLLTPVIAFFFTDLYPTATNSRSYVTVGEVGSRQFILRFTDVWYCCSTLVDQGLLMEVILSEGTNTVEMIFYRIPLSPTIVRNVEIGLQDSGSLIEWVYIWNDAPFSVTSAAALANKRIIYTPVNQAVVRGSSTAAPAPSSSAQPSSTGVSSSAIPSSSARSSSTSVSSSTTPSSSTSPSSSPGISSSAARSSSTGVSSSATVSSSARPSSSSAVPSSSAAPVASSSPSLSPSSSTGSPAPITDDASRSSSSLSDGAIAGIVIGCIIGVLVLALFCFFALVGYRRDGEKFSAMDSSDEPSKIGGDDDDVHQEEHVEGHDGGEVEMETV